MAYEERLVNYIRESLAHLPQVEEVEKMGGLTFMVQDKMCIRVRESELLCRIAPNAYDTALERKGCHEWIYKGKPMKGWVVVDKTGTETKADFDHWIGLCVAFNSSAKSSKRN